MEFSLRLPTSSLLEQKADERKHRVEGEWGACWKDQCLCECVSGGTYGSPVVSLI